MCATAMAAVVERETVWQAVVQPHFERRHQLSDFLSCPCENV
jgi:hypothetical protein